MCVRSSVVSILKDNGFVQHEFFKCIYSGINGSSYYTVHCCIGALLKIEDNTNTLHVKAVSLLELLTDSQQAAGCIQLLIFYGVRHTLTFHIDQRFSSKKMLINIRLRIF